MLITRFILVGHILQKFREGERAPSELGGLDGGGDRGQAEQRGQYEERKSHLCSLVYLLYCVVVVVVDSLSFVFFLFGCSSFFFFLRVRFPAKDEEKRQLDLDAQKSLRQLYFPLFIF